MTGEASPTTVPDTPTAACDAITGCKAADSAPDESGTDTPNRKSSDAGRGWCRSRSMGGRCVSIGSYKLSRPGVN